MGLIIRTLITNDKTFRFIVKKTLNNKPLMCKFPREKVPAGTYRPFMNVIGNDTWTRTLLFQVIEYPESLWGTLITPNDPIEMELIELKNNFPDFDSITIQEI